MEPHNVLGQLLAGGGKGEKASQHREEKTAGKGPA
jgi:hypothetical protein